VPFVVWILTWNRYIVGLIVAEILRCKDFGVLAWNCLFTTLFGEFLGNIFPIWHHPSSWPLKGTSLGGNTSFEPPSVRISATVRPGCVTEKKNSITKKSLKCYISPIWGSPRWADSTLKLHGGCGWCPRRNHVCQISKWNLYGLRLYRGSNFGFSYWFLHGPYNSAALMRCLWCVLYQIKKTWSPMGHVNVRRSCTSY